MAHLTNGVGRAPLRQISSGVARRRSRSVDDRIASLSGRDKPGSGLEGSGVAFRVGVSKPAFSLLL